MSKELEVNAPKVIYLQIGDDHEGEYSDEATWCADKIHNTDIAYVLRSYCDELAAKLAEAEATCEALRNDGINKIMEATDDQIDALIRMEGSNPDDIANLAKKVAELAIANVKLAEAERQLAELKGRVEDLLINLEAKHECLQQAHSRKEELKAKLTEAERQLEELRGLRKQEPVAWADAKPEGYTYHGMRELPKGKHYLYAAPIPPTGETK